MSISKYISRQFSNPSGIGGTVSTFIMNTMNKTQYKSVFNNIDTCDSDNVLDIGFGNGYLIKNLANTMKGMFYGIDISSDMLQKALSKSNDLIKSKRLDLAVGNVMKMAYEDNFFSFVYTVNTVYFWDDIAKGFTEIKRVLKPGGIFINVIYSKEYLDKIKYTQFGFNKYTPEDLKDITKENGFEIIDLIEIKRNSSYCLIAKVV